MPCSPREDENGQLVLIDGHLRADTTPDTEVPRARAGRR